jgi:serine/threonine protein phosphatase PrpC
MAIISPGREALLAENYNKLQAHIQTRGYLPPLPSARGSGPILTLEEQAVYNRNHPRLKEAEAKDYLEKEKVAAKSYRHRPLGFKYKETNLIDGMHNKHFEVPGFEAGIGTLTNDMYKQKTFGLRGPKTIKIAGKIAGQDTPLTYFMVLESHQGSDALEFIGHEFLPTGKMFATELEIQLRAENAGGISEAGILNALNLTCASLNDQLNGSIEDHRSGCVMGMALFLLDRIWFVNMGHTRMIWVNCETGETTQMTEDAVASLPRDLEEIQARHGRVVQNDGRYCINGVVPTSRAFGYPKERGVIPLPKITYLSHSEIPPNSLVLLGTSHLWKMGTPEEIGQAIIDHKDLPTWQLATHLTGSANGWHELLHRHSTTDILPKSRIPEMTLILVKIKPDEIRPFQMPIYRLPSGDPSDGPD